MSQELPESERLKQLSEDELMEIIRNKGHFYPDYDDEDNEIHKILFEGRGASPEEAAQQIMLAKTYGIHTTVDRKGVPGMWPASTTVEHVKKILVTHKAQLAPRVQAYLQAYLSDQRSSAQRPEVGEKAETESGILAKLIELSPEEREALRNVKRKILGIFFELPKEEEGQPVPTPGEEMSKWDTKKKKGFEILSDPSLLDEEAVNLTLQNMDMSEYTSLEQMIKEARASSYKPGVKDPETLKLVMRRAEKFLEVLMIKLMNELKNQ